MEYQEDLAKDKVRKQEALMEHLYIHFGLLYSFVLRF